MLNKYIWKLYLQSGGDKVVDMFRRNLSEKLTEDYIDQIIRMRKVYCANEGFEEDTKEQLQMLMDYLEEIVGKSDSIADTLQIDTNVTYTDVLEDLYDMLLENYSIPGNALDSFSYNMIYYSTQLAVLFPDCFIPYYYLHNFNVLQLIADAFDITLPPLPVKKDYKGRIYYYGEISRTMLEFGLENGLSRFELYAFLYDFSPQYIGGVDSYIIKDLPAPRSAYFIGSSNKDIFLPKKASDVTSWQCSPDTRVGDMIVMYVLTPVSAVTTICRACSVGFIDPFFYYYRCVYISQAVSTTPFTLQEMRSDQIFKELPIVRKNMQGINGVELYPSVYNYLVAKVKAAVPLLEYEKTENDEEYTCEKDVENKLIKPLITKLGYTENEYEQQLYIEIGNHNKALIPDFVLLPDKTHGHTSGFGIIEAKRSIPSEKVLKEVFIQARSYARVLSTKFCAVASKERIWVSQRKDDFEEIIFEATWKQLNQEDRFYELEKLLGN